MKFKTTAYYTKELEYLKIELNLIRVKSLCGKYTRELTLKEYERKLVDGFYISYGEDAYSRLTRRLSKIGVNIELMGNVPWVYLHTVNGVIVKEKKNARHGFCIGYNTDPSKLRFKKDLFSKIREMINESDN